MNYLFFLFFGFSTLWAGLNLFDDEVLLIVSMLVGSALVLAGILSAPMVLKVVIEIALVASLFHVCVACIERGDHAEKR